MMCPTHEAALDGRFQALVVDDEELYAAAIGRALDQRQIHSDLAFNGKQAIARARTGVYQLILLDQRLPDEDGIALIPMLLAAQPQATLMMMTAYHTIPDAVRAIRQGASDYIVKEANLQPLLERAEETRRRCQVVNTAKGWREHNCAGLLGHSSKIRGVLKQLDQIAKSPDTTVLLTGETGVGKEVAARYLHRMSRPSASQMVTVDCIALPSGLAESLLFGHEKGAFTGAVQRQIGAFEQAGEGTLFLDEIGDISELQGKLLRVLESRKLNRVGSVRDIPLRARVTCATNKDLAKLVEEGSFRLDLYQRLSIFPIHIPPLRERGDDILLLAEHFRSFFAEKLGRAIEPLDEQVRQRLMAYDFPGNVRELKNILERAVIIADSDRITPAHLPQRVLRGRAEPSSPPIPLDFVPGIDSLESVERRMITQALRRSRNVKAEAARLLGISRFQLLRRLEKYGMRVSED